MLLCAPATSASDNSPHKIAVIVHRDLRNEPLNQADLANIYRRKLNIDAHGQAFVPVNLPVSATLREAFANTLFQQSPQEMEAYWNEQYYQGISPPYVLDSTLSMLRFVAVTPGAIGYVLDCQVTDDVAVVLLLPIDSQHAAITETCD
jgi:hypothetical protein